MNSTTSAPSKKRAISITLIVLVCIILGFLWYWRHNRLYPSTDDAYVHANIVHIAAQVNGPVASISAHNHQVVKKGQILVTIDPRPYQLTVRKAQAYLANIKQKIKAEIATVKVNQAQVDAAKAQLYNAKKNAQRVLTLANHGQATKAQADNAKENYTVSQAGVIKAQQVLQASEAQLGAIDQNNHQIQQAQASLAQAQLDLSYCYIKAPANGVLSNFSLRPGTMVTAGTPLFAIVETQRWWVDANYRETDLARIHIGQTASITTDLYPDHTFSGKVIAISSASGATFSLLPPENATGNWIKVTQRFPVKILIDHPTTTYPLRVGASSHVVINTVDKPKS